MTPTRASSVREAWELRARAFLAWRRTGSLAARLVAALAGACFMGLCAQVRLFTPLSPVPFTGQTFGAILIGGVLGAELGALSIALYVALGVAGVPWFAKAPAGSWEMVNAVTGGYIGGFALAAAFVGLMTDRFERARRHAGLFLVMLAGAVLVYVPGVAVLMAVTGRPLGEAICVGALVFLPLDAVKALAAAGLASAVLPGRVAPGGPGGLSPHGPPL